MRIALYQPDIAQNTGTILRLAACLGVRVDIIGPAGFDMSDRALRRAGLDYLHQVALWRHASFEAFQQERAAAGGRSRLILLTTDGTTSHIAHAFTADGYPAARSRERRRSTSCPRHGGRTDPHSDATRLALPQCRGGCGHGAGRGPAADGGIS